MNELSKVCKSCRKELPLSSFTPQAGCRLGCLPRCRECNNAAARDRYVGPGRKVKRSQNDDREARRQATARWRTRNPGKDAEQQRASRAADPNRFRVYDKRWRERHPDQVREKNFQRRSKVQQFRRGVVAYKKLRESFPNCYLCGMALSGVIEYDHVVPLSPRLGEPQGAHSTENLRPTHRACNKRKSNIPLDRLDWYHGPTDLGEQYEQSA